MENEAGKPDGDAPPVKEDSNAAKTAEETAAAETQPAVTAPADGAFHAHHHEKGWKAGLKDIGKFIWNKETKTVCGRGCRRWALLIGFYIIFYLTLACIFIGLLVTVLGILDKNSPMQTYKDQDSFYQKSLIQRYPAVIITPLPDREINKDSPLIWIARKKAERKAWGEIVKKEISGYEKYLKKHPNCKKCFNITTVDQSCKENLFGYDTRQPTFLIRVSKILKWTPKFFKTQPAAEKYIIKKIKNDAILDHFRAQAKAKHWSPGSSNVLVLCAGNTPADDQLLGGVKYCTNPYLEGKYFPFGNKEPYIAPFVMIQFLNAVPGIPITVACYPILDGLIVNEKKAWSKETFEFMIE